MNMMRNENENYEMRLHISFSDFIIVESLADK